MLNDKSAANNMPDIYENGTAKVREKIEKWDIFKSVNYLINESVSKRELLALYKPTETLARHGSTGRICLPALEYAKLKGKKKLNFALGN